MDPGYETIVDPMTIIWTLSAVLIHAASMALQLGLSAYLIGTALLAWLAPSVDARWLRRLGALPRGDAVVTHRLAMRVVLGIGLLLPLALGAPFSISLAAFLASVALLVATERVLPVDAIVPGRVARHAAVAAAALLAAFTVWEGEDPLALGAELSANAQGWRVHELEWQLRNDLETPKVGDLAPDFELQDPSGRVTVRLSDFRGKRPVALAFGSYT